MSAKPIPGFPGYSITRDGQVQNLETGHIVKAFTRDKRRSGDYLIVALGRKGTQKIQYLHRLLALTYPPNPKKLATVNHIDGDKTNNSLKNLEWLSHAENLRHAVRLGLNLARRGTQSHAAKLTRQQVSQVRALLQTGIVSQKEIADYFNVSRGCILGIHTKQSWRE